MAKIKPRFKVGDWIHYIGTYEGYLHVERIEIVNDVVYYYEDSSHVFVCDESGNDSNLILADEKSDERLSRYLLYLELKKEFNHVG